MSISYKSTGMLLDELITTTFKIEVNPSEANVKRKAELDAEIGNRLDGNRDKIYFQVIKLQVVLRQCWDAQETVKQLSHTIYQQTLTIPYLNDLLALAEAGVKAQTTNATRNMLIREIDEILGESNGPLNKTY